VHHVGASLVQCRLILSQLASHTNVTITVNGEEQQLDPGTTVAELLARLEVSSKTVAVEVNQELVPRRSHAELTLQPGDRLEIVGFVGGG
jgi:thiamine biosynthesis protein ThiS